MKVTDLFGTNIMTSSQLVCQLIWQSAIHRQRRGRVQIPYRPEFFFRPYFHYYSSSVHYCEDHSHSRLYLQFKYMTFRYSQSITLCLLMHSHPTVNTHEGLWGIHLTDSLSPTAFVRGCVLTNSFISCEPCIIRGLKMTSNFLPSVEPDTGNCKLHNEYDIQSCVLAGISVLLGTAVCFYGEKLTVYR